VLYPILRSNFGEIRFWNMVIHNIF
jgi:hypothetical protein